MAVRIRYRAEVSVSSSSSEERDLSNLRHEQVTDSFNEGGSSKLILAAAAVDVAACVDFISDMGFIYIKIAANTSTDTPGPITVKLNSIGASEITIAPLSGKTQGHLLLTTEGVTALYFSNPGTVDMEVILTFAGV